MSFSATDSILEGFRLVRRNPMVLVAWTLVYFVYAMVSLLASTASIEPLIAAMEQLEAVERSGTQNFQAYVGPLNALFAASSYSLWVLPLMLIATSVIITAVARGVLRPEDGGFGYLRFGMDEVRVLVVQVVVGLMIGLATLTLTFIAAMIGGLAAAAIGGWGVLVMFLAFLAAIAVVVWLAVRWSLAVPVVVDQRRLLVFESFALTKDRFWPLLGMSVIVVLIYVGVSLLLTMVAAPLTLASGLSMFTVTPENQAEVMRRMTLANPWMIAIAAFNAFSYALTVGVLNAPFSAAYRDIKRL